MRTLLLAPLMLAALLIINEPVSASASQVIYVGRVHYKYQGVFYPDAQSLLQHLRMTDPQRMTIVASVCAPHAQVMAALDALGAANIHSVTFGAMEEGLEEKEGLEPCS